MPLLKASIPLCILPHVLPPSLPGRRGPHHTTNVPMPPRSEMFAWLNRYLTLGVLPDMDAAQAQASKGGRGAGWVVAGGRFG